MACQNPLTSSAKNNTLLGLNTREKKLSHCTIIWMSWPLGFSLPVNCNDFYVAVEIHLLKTKNLQTLTLFVAICVPQCFFVVVVGLDCLFSLSFNIQSLQEVLAELNP